MHFEILVEDQSGKKALDILVPKIVGNDHTFRICGTWEKLADAVYPGGAKKLSTQGWQTVGAEKSKGAEKISPQLDVDNNQSPSFCYFRDKLRELIAR